MSDNTPAFETTLPKELYQLFCAGLYSYRYQYPGNDIEQLSRLLKRWFMSADNHRVTIAGQSFGINLSSKGNSFCLMTTPIVGNPTLYDIDGNAVNDFFNSKYKAT